MATASATIDIERSADDIVEFILDVQAYRAVDPRLRKIRWVRRLPGCTIFRFRPQLMGLPAPLSTQTVTRGGPASEATSRKRDRVTGGPAGHSIVDQTWGD